MTQAVLDRPVLDVPRQTQTPRSRRVIWARRLRPIRPTESRVFFVLSGTLYGYVAILGTLNRGVWFGDALTRLNQAESVLYSTDPHLAAVGFVYGPIPSLALLPFLPLQHFWPWLETANVFGCVESAVFMAASVAVLVGLLKDLAVPVVTRWVLAAIYAAHPILVVYGSNGMAEAPMLFFLMVATRWLMRWLQPKSARAGHLLVVGCALAGAYLCRVEPLGAGLAVTALVAVVSFQRVAGPLRTRVETALTDVTLVGGPFFVTVVGWALIGRVIVGDWLSYLHSNSQQVVGARSSLEQVFGTSLLSRADYLGQQLLHLEPLFAVAVVMALAPLLLRLDNRVLAPLVVFGATLAADIFTFLIGSNFGFLRFYTTLIPFTVICAGLVAARPRRGSGRAAARAGLWRRTLGLSVSVVSGLIAVAIVAPGLVGGWELTDNMRLAGQETRYYDALLNPAYARAHQGGDVNAFVNERHVAHWLDAHRMKRGSVLVDAGVGFGILTASRDRSQFISTSDLVFERAVADPNAFHVPYLLVSSGTGVPDRIAETYPTLYGNGDNLGTLVADFPSKTGPSWRLYKVIPGAAGAGATVGGSGGF